MKKHVKHQCQRKQHLYKRNDFVFLFIKKLLKLKLKIVCASLISSQSKQLQEIKWDHTAISSQQRRSGLIITSGLKSDVLLYCSAAQIENACASSANENVGCTKSFSTMIIPIVPMPSRNTFNENIKQFFKQHTINYSSMDLKDVFSTLRIQLFAVMMVLGMLCYKKKYTLYYEHGYQVKEQNCLLPITLPLARDNCLGIIKLDLLIHILNRHCVTVVILQESDQKQQNKAPNVSQLAKIRGENVSEREGVII